MSPSPNTNASTAAPLGRDDEFTLDEGASLFGLPLDLDLVAEPSFDLDAEPKHRSLAVAIAPPPALQRTHLDVPAPTAAFNAASLATIHAGPSAAPAPLQAPQLPFFHKSPATMFQTGVTAAAPVVAELEGAFAARSVQWTFNARALAFECEAFVAGTAQPVSFEVRMFALADDRHQVEFQRWSGCRASFYVLLAELEAHLPCCPTGKLGGGRDIAATPPRLLSVPPLPAALLATATATATVGYRTEPPTPAGLARVAKTQPASLEVNVLAAQLDSAATAGGASLLAVLTAVANVAQAATAPDTLAWLEAVVAAPRVRREWLGAGCVHTRRATVQLLFALTHHAQPELAARFATAIVRAGLVPALQLEADPGVEDDHSPDHPLVHLAQATLAQCRAA